MSRPEQLTLAGHVDRHLRPLTVLLPFAVSILVAMAVTGLCLWDKVREAKLVVSTITEHMATLLEIQDGPEILRLLSSVKRERSLDLMVTQSGQVIASTRSPNEIFRPVMPFDGLQLSNGIAVGVSTLQVTEPIKRENGPDLGASLVLVVPFSNALKLSLGAFALVFLLGVFITRGYSALTRKAISAALEPLDSLKQAIRRLSTATALVPVSPVGIVELDEIGKTVLKTQGELFTTRERLVSARIKEELADNYKRLIHDLRTPVASMNALSVLASENPDDETIQGDAKRRIPRIAQQILGQLSAATKNVEFGEPRLVKEDVRNSVTEATELVSSIAADRDRCIVVEASLPTVPILLPHDKVLLARAVQNLLKNAVEAGATHICASLEETKDGAVIRIEDNGPGIKEDDLPLFLVGRGHSQKHERSAIGLSTVNHIIRGHGGKVVYRRSALGGAQFDLILKAGPTLMNREQEARANG